MNGRKAALFMLALLLLSGLFVSSAAAEDRTMDRFYEEFHLNYGRGQSDASVGGRLAWGEVYGLDANLAMYKTTDQKQWLDNFVERANRVLANATDFDGDGYMGWPDPLYSHAQAKNRYFAIPGVPSGATQIIQNGTFETAAVPDTPDQWSKTGNASMVYRSTTAGDAFAGSAGVVIESDGTNENRLVQSFSYTPGKRYLMEAYVAVYHEKTNARIEIFNQTTGKAIAVAHIVHMGYEQQLLEFVAPSSGTLQIRLGLVDYADSGYKARFDNVTIHQLDDEPAEIVLNGSFETLQSGDSTMPQSWSRWPYSYSADVYSVNGMNEYYNGVNSSSRGLAVTTSNNSWEIAQQSISYTPSAEYVVSFWGRVSDPKYGGKVEILSVNPSNPSDVVVVAYKTFHNTLWEFQRFNFTAPSTSGRDLLVRLYQTDWQSYFTAYFDLVSVKPVVQREAAAWEHAGYTLAQARRSNSADVSPRGNWGLELVYDGIDYPKMTQLLHNYKPSSKYAFQATARVTSGASGKLQVFDVQNNTVYASQSFSNTGFVNLRMDFTTPSDGRPLRLEVVLDGGLSGARLHASEVHVSQVLEYQAHDARIGKVLLDFSRLVFANGDLHSDYLDDAESYRDFVADNLYPKWNDQWVQLTGSDGSDNGQGTYTWPSGFSIEYFPTRSLPHNMNLIMAHMLYHLYDTTDGVPEYSGVRGTYLSRANDLMRAFKDKIWASTYNDTYSTDAYAWNYWDRMGTIDDGLFYQTGWEDIGHSNADVAAVMEAYRHGQVFTAADIQKFVNTFVDIMWNQSLIDPVLCNVVGLRPTVTYAKEVSYLFLHWIDMAEFDHTIWDIGNAICQEERCLIYSAAGISLWSRNKAINTGFESIDAVDATLPRYWKRWQANASTAYLDTSDVYLGKQSAVVKTDGAMWHVLEQKIEDYQPNTPLVVSFAGKTNGLVGGRVEVLDQTTTTVLGSKTFTDTTWTKLSFTTDELPAASGHNILLRLYSTDYTVTNGEIRFDEVRALPLHFDSHIPNGSFETEDMWDSTLPRLWARGASTISANAVIDPSTESMGEASLKLTTTPGGAAQELIYEWTGYKPSGSYELLVDAVTNGAASGGKIKVVDVTASTTLAEVTVSGTVWAEYADEFTAPSNYDHVLRVIITHQNPAVSDGTLWVDDFSIALQ